MQKIVICLMLVCFVGMPSSATTYTHGHDILIGRQQALSNELADIILQANQSQNADYINMLKEENKYLKERIIWLEKQIDKIDK